MTNDAKKKVVVRDNANVLIFIGGFACLSIGLWRIDQNLALITCGGVLAGLVLIDAVVQIFIGRKQ